MTRTLTTSICALLLCGSSAAMATGKAAICLSTGPVENIGASGFEGGEEVDLQLASRFFTVNLLNNSAHPVKFEAQFYQIDGPGDFEGGTWPKPKVLISSGTRASVPAGANEFLNTDTGDDAEPVYGYEAQVKVTRVDGKPVHRNQLLVTGHARSEDKLAIVPELRVINKEWTEIPCTW
ncbi:hypothetical protein ACW73L_12060 [Methylolobus aquaticus]